MDVFSYLKRIKVISIIILIVFGICYIFLSKILANNFYEWFSSGLINFIHIFIISGFSLIFFTVIFSYINKQFLIMKHFQDELKEATDTMRRMSEETERKNLQLLMVNEQMSNLHKIIREMAQTMDLERILGIILEGICQYLKYDRAVIFLIDESKRMVKPIHSYCVKGSVDGDIEVSLDEKNNPVVSTILEKKPKIVNEYRLISESMKIYSDINEKDIVGIVPLEARGKIIGVLVVDNFVSKKKLNENDLRDLMIFTNQAGLAIENARLYETEKRFKEQLQIQVNDAIKRLQETQAQLIQTEKLAALGEMAAIVTHEVRNPLSTIRGSAELINEITANEHPSKKYVSFIMKEVDRLNRIVTDILAFSRPPQLIMKKVNINNIIEELWVFLEASDFIKYGIQSYKELDRNIPAIHVDPEQIKQVLLNIIQNACHFMANSKIKQLKVKTYLNSRSVFIEISDTGQGIPPENMKKIFDPFFTTKVRGTGLGLSVSKNIVESHGGKINVKSEVGVGSTFTIILPIVQPVKNNNSKVIG